MMLDATLRISEDTFTKYLNNLQTHFEDKQHEMLEEMGEVFVSDVKELAPKWTFTLAESGEDEEEWVFEKLKNGNSLKIEYTGLGNTQSWWEFSNSGNQNAPPDRDYAFYQETGLDDIADPKYAKHKFFILMTTRRQDTRHHINNIAQTYLRQIMELK